MWIIAYLYLRKEVGDKMEELFTSITNLGFPIVLSMFLLMRIETKLDKLSEAINELNKTIVSMSDI